MFNKVHKAFILLNEVRKFKAWLCDAERTYKKKTQYNLDKYRSKTYIVNF